MIINFIESVIFFYCNCLSYFFRALLKRISVELTEFSVEYEKDLTYKHQKLIASLGVEVQDSDDMDDPMFSKECLFFVFCRCPKV
jgi:hypothetical protein